MLSLQLDPYLILKQAPKITSIDGAKELFDRDYENILDGVGFIELPHQDVKIIENLAQKYELYDEIIVVGLGGSSCGPKLLVEALQSEASKKSIHFLDTIDPFSVNKLFNKIKLPNSLFIIISKSGQTPETISLFYCIKKLLKDNSLAPNSHIVFISDTTTGHLNSLAYSKKYDILSIPPNVGGRFSVLSPVGLFVAKLAGISISQLLEGAKYINQNALTTQLPDNIAFKLAVFNILEYQTENKNIQVIMNYCDKINSFGDWVVQLYAESLGKSTISNSTQNPSNVGFTPHKARGVSDQHSQLQLFNDGPNDKSYLFIKSLNSEPIKLLNNLEIPTIKESTLSYLSNKKLQDLFDIEFVATRESLIEQSRPVITVVIDKIDEYHIGALLQLFMTSTVYQASMLGVNAFDQPGVEKSKKLTKYLLSSNLTN
jgi:glucose-6-phosphate isomerase